MTSDEWAVQWDRSALVVRARDAGATFTEIARGLKVSAWRARSIYFQHLDRIAKGKRSPREAEFAEPSLRAAFHGSVYRSWHPVDQEYARKCIDILDVFCVREAA